MIIWQYFIFLYKRESDIGRDCCLRHVIESFFLSLTDSHAYLPCIAALSGSDFDSYLCW